MDIYYKKDNCTLALGDTFEAIEKIKSESIDMIFADPPYELPIEKFTEITELVFERDFLNENGTLIIEHSSRTDLSNLPHFVTSKKYGGCVFSMFE